MSSPKVIPRPPRSVSYDATAFLVDGKRELLISGEIHYARVPEAEWERVLDTAKAAGINCVATYVFWNWHEPREGQYEFSGPQDLSRFLQLCRERDLYVILRAGPYCCAEWNFGGFPAWLKEKPGIVFRTYNQPYLEQVEKYFRRLFAEVTPQLATKGGPIVLVQLENEYANIAARYQEDGDRYLKWILELGLSCGVDVPVVMCEGGAPGAIEALNGFHITPERIAEFKKRCPNEPTICTEFWTGWYDTWGYEHPLRDAHNIAYHLLRFLAEGGTAWNYYMWHGGTNFGRTAMYLQASCYGFDAPLDEWGRLSAKGEYLAGLHAAVSAHQEYLLSGKRTNSPGKAVWQKDGRELRVEWDEKNRCATLFSPTGDALFTTHPLSASSASKASPGKCSPWRELAVGQDWNWTPEPLPSRRSDSPIIRDEPAEQLPYTRDETDYCWYSHTVFVEQAGFHELHLPFCGDFLRVYVNGEEAGSTQVRLEENRGSTSPGSGKDIKSANDLEQTESNYAQTFSVSLERGENKIDILCCALGLIKGDWMISGPMTEEKKGIWGGVFLDGRKLLRWEMRPGLTNPDRAPSVAPSTSRPSQSLGWWRTTVEIDAALLHDGHDFRLDLSAFDKGLLYINGRLLGRYWLIEADGHSRDNFWPQAELLGLGLEGKGHPTQACYRVPPSWLRERNEVLLFEESSPGNPSLVLQTRTAA